MGAGSRPGNGWRRTRLALGTSSAVLLGLGAAWAAGFACFNSAIQATLEPPAAADGIVALTGGTYRIQTALNLLADRRAPLLLVSGVSEKADLGDLARLAPIGPDQAVRITLGRTARTTAGNAAETASWARGHHMEQLIVVTSDYHMPRALLELRRALPEATLHPVAAKPPAVRDRPRAAARLLAGEYDKLLAVRLGVAPILRAGGPP